jgi:hypothetical protein
MQFEQFSLDPRINAGIRGAGYTTPTPIQQQAIPVVLQKRDNRVWRSPTLARRRPLCRILIFRRDLT